MESHIVRMVIQVCPMYGKMKHKGLISSVIISLLFSCNNPAPDGFEINGQTQGTTYSVILADQNSTVNKVQIDSLLLAFDSSLSSYIENSIISTLNKTKDSTVISDPTGYFKKCFEISTIIYQATNGAFDPSVYPLVEGWGFRNDNKTPLTEFEVDSIMDFISFEEGLHYQIQFLNSTINFTKNDERFKFDFNAVAQGLAVDVVDTYLSELGFKNYYIEIGGEIIVRGKNRDGQKWKIGVDLPEENLENRKLENIIYISDKAIATSGNYRNFYVDDGVKYAHTINPKTGFPVRHSLLSVTVIADDCASADAYATAFMVMGKDKTIEFIKMHPKAYVEAYLLFSDGNGAIKRKMSSGFSNYLK